MKKRIYVNVIGLLLLCILLLSFAISIIFFNVTKNQEVSFIKDTGALVADLLNLGKGYGTYTDYISDTTGTMRLSIIAPDGTVLLDNKTYANKLENHNDREEFEQALQSGQGESIRFSNTLGSATYYYALKLQDGNILRMSKTMSSITQIFTAVLPAIIVVAALVFIIANFMVRKLTHMIIQPINDIDLENDNIVIYDELSPFIKKINQQQKEISEQLLSLENRANTTRAITENMKEGLIFIDKKGVILSANISALKIWNEENIVDKNILHTLRHMDLLKKIKDSLLGESFEMSLERNNKNYSVYINPVYRGHEVNGAIILFLDSTEKYKSEKQRKEFSANVSHELKTPLTTISALSEMIGNGMAKEEDIKGFATKISEQTKRLIDMINDIIRLSEFDESNAQREYSNFDLHELANSVCASLQEKALEKNVELQVAGESLFISANKRMIDELLYNLLDNAIKYNKEDGKVMVSSKSIGDYNKITVADTGIGIPLEHQSRVFERFYRVDHSRSYKTGGTGLGLSIVKHIVEYHKGTIAMESNHAGTTIVCFIKNMTNEHLQQRQNNPLQKL